MTHCNLFICKMYESWLLDLVIKNGKHVKVLLKDGSQAIHLLANSFCGNQELSAILICELIDFVHLMRSM